MKYSTTKTYTLKRSVIEFGKRIFKGLTRPNQKFGADMTYGMLAAKSCLLTSIVDQLHERTKKVNAVERLGRHLCEGIPEAAKNEYHRFIREWVDFDRPAYQKVVGMLRPGDVLVVKSIDRLGRNYSDILEQWRIITKEIGASIVVIDMPLLDTRSNRDLTGTLIADIVLQLLSYVAETERAFIKQRQKEGIDAARARGQRFGAPPKERPAEQN